MVSRVAALSQEVSSIGRRNAIAERVHLSGSDEISSLGSSINGMLDELEKSQTQFLLISEHIHQIFWIRDARTGKYEYISRACEHILGRTRELLAENPASWKEAVHPDDRGVTGRMLVEQDAGRPSEAYYRILVEGGRDSLALGAHLSAGGCRRGAAADHRSHRRHHGVQTE